jgi:hypothetical protein
MPLYEAQVSHDGLEAGQVYDLTDYEVEERAGAIETGFLLPVGDPYWAATPETSPEITGPPVEDAGTETPTE